MFAAQQAPSEGTRPPALCILGGDAFGKGNHHRHWCYRVVSRLKQLQTSRTLQGRSLWPATQPAANQGSRCLAGTQGPSK